MEISQWVKKKQTNNWKAVGGQKHLGMDLVVVTVCLGAGGWARELRDPHQSIVLCLYRGTLKQSFVAGVNQILFLLSGGAVTFG